MPEDLLRIFCNSCNQITNHEIVGSYEPPGTEGEWIRWLIVRCAGCNSPAFYMEHWIEEENDWSRLGGDAYPSRMHRKIRTFVGLTANLDSIYREAIMAFNNQSYTLCAGGLRALIEGVCADHGITDGPRRNGNGRDKNLECKIEGLRENQIITTGHATALHENRLLGNQALHDLETPDSQTLSAAIDLIELVLDNLYNMPHNINNLRQIRQRANNRQQQ